VSQDALFPVDGEPLARQVTAARWVLRQLNFDAERSNERSALVLLALLGLTPDGLWTEARNPLMRTVEIMDWLRQYYGKDWYSSKRRHLTGLSMRSDSGNSRSCSQGPPQGWSTSPASRPGKR